MKAKTSIIQELRIRLYQVEAELADTLQRMPAHGIKPGFMAALLDLEIVSLSSYLTGERHRFVFYAVT